MMLRVHKIDKPTFKTLCSVSFLQGVLVDSNEAGKLVLAEVSLAEDSWAEIKEEGSKLLVTDDSLVEDSLSALMRDRSKLLVTVKNF